jgi:hypothetical protein
MSNIYGLEPIWFVCVSLLLKVNVGVLLEVLRSPHSDAPLLVCYGSAIILWVLYIPHYISVTLNLFEFYLMHSYLYCCDV